MEQAKYQKKNQSELAPSHAESTDSVPPVSSSSDVPQVFNRQPDLEEEEWCPNLQFDSSKPDWDASDKKMIIFKLKLDTFPFQVPSSHDPDRPDFSGWCPLPPKMLSTCVLLR